ncbi:hypothetical protein [Aromatoleum evansii]|uniref:hypothetical protein n=1 Tax=Aromatoleum evansii TaxID=59406 RepID=UPI00145D4915|nr:hypothetical protein [Aromatoleum evansii]NMG31091.1 hypothetical protein [Aromatoleum evansii]
MSRPIAPLLSDSPSRRSVDRCNRTVKWVSRRLRQDERDEQEAPLTRSNRGAISAFPAGRFRALSVVKIYENSTRNTAVNVAAERRKVIAEWLALEGEWWSLFEPPGPIPHTLTRMIAKISRWLDETLDPLERRRLLGYLRQCKLEPARSKTVRVTLKPELYEEVTQGVPPKQRHQFVAALLSWAAASSEARAAVFAKLGLRQKGGYGQGMLADPLDGRTESP